MSHNQAAPSMRSFLLMWVGQAFSLFGTNLVQFALVWYLTASTGSATVLAVSMMMALLPQVFLGPFAGALVDRWNRRAVMMVADAGTALATLLLAALFYFNVVEVWHIYVLMLVRALGSTFHLPATLAATSMMVPEERLSQVSGLNQFLEGAMMVIPPLFGALLIAILPMQFILAIDIVTAALAMSILYFIHIPQPVRQTLIMQKVTVIQDLVSGFKYVWGWPGLFILILNCTLLNFFFNPAFALLPLVVTRHFKGGAPQLAWVESAMAAGLIVGGLVMGAWGGWKRRIVSVIVFEICAGLMLALFGLMPADLLIPGLGVLSVFGAMMAMSNGPLMAIPQAAVELKMQGRVLSLMNALAMAMSPIGLAIAGPLSDAIDPRTWFVISGAATIVADLVLLAIPAVMHIEDRIVKEQEQPAARSSEPTIPSLAIPSPVTLVSGRPILSTGVFNQQATAHFSREEVRALRAAAAARKK